MPVLREYLLQPFEPIADLPRHSGAVEVIVLSYNSGDWVEKCLRSIFNQLDPPETSILIHDDGSTDKSQELIKKIALESPFPITLISRTSNSLPLGADFYWELLSTSRSEMISILDADDFWLNNMKLKLQHEAFRADSSVVLSFHDYALFSNEREELSTIFPSYIGVRTLNCLPSMAAENPIGSSTVMFRKSALSNIDMTGRQYLPFQDFAVWAQLAAQGKHKYLSGLMTAYRRHEASLSGSKKWTQLFAEGRKVNLWLLPRLQLGQFDKLMWRFFGSTAIRFLWLALSRISRRRRAIDFGPDVSSHRRR